MTEINVTGVIVGGPKDGASVRFTGTSERDDVFDVMDKMEMDGHVYKIVEFDKQKMRAVLMW